MHTIFQLCARFLGVLDVSVAVGVGEREDIGRGGVRRGGEAEGFGRLAEETGFESGESLVYYCVYGVDYVVYQRLKSGGRRSVSVVLV